MAIRIHIVAARECDAAQFRSAFAEKLGVAPESLDVGHDGDWAWLIGSVWCWSSELLDEAARVVSCPVLRVTTEDGARWPDQVEAVAGLEDQLVEAELEEGGPGVDDGRLGDLARTAGEDPREGGHVAHLQHRPEPHGPAAYLRPGARSWTASRAAGGASRPAADRSAVGRWWRGCRRGP